MIIPHFLKGFSSYPNISAGGWINSITACRHGGTQAIDKPSINR
ncbi:hypothetical protein [Bacillus atrophaeus]|nr:hypothetical protein [Bacillus atrophaeus]